MDDNVLEIRDYQGEGYSPLVDYGEWRVAVLRWLDGIQPDRIESMERHMSSDEVFVLVQGKGVLILGGNQADINKAVPQVMEQGVIYNIKAKSWHTVLLSRDAKVLIVENRDVDRNNSEYKSISMELRRQILERARQEHLD